MKIKNLLTRTVSGVIYCALIVGLTLMGREGVLLLAGLLGALATVELAKISHGLTRRTIPLIIVDVAGVLSLCMIGYGYALWLWIAILIVRFVEELYVKNPHPLRSLANSALSQIYIGVPMCLMVSLANYLDPRVVLLLFIFIWINDTGAFLVGSLLGRHRLFERISPKKSWEGFFGGLLLVVVAAMLFGLYCPGTFGLGRFDISLWGWFGLGVVASVFSTWGDLVESMIKRDLQIKDSGHIIPGHGGILDRIDSLLLVVPAAFIYLLFLACNLL